MANLSVRLTTLSVIGAVLITGVIYAPAAFALPPRSDTTAGVAGQALGSAVCVQTALGIPFTSGAALKSCDLAQSTPPPAPSVSSTSPPVTTLGSERPGPTNTGVREGTVLTVHHGDIVVTAAGTVIDGLDVRGQITVKAANVTIKNSIVRGPLAGVSGSIFLILTTGQPGLQIIDTEIAASTPNQDVKGVGGSNYTLTRVNIHSVIDSVNVLGDNVTVERSWLHDNLDYGPDENGVGGPSHADSIQIQKGSHIRVHDNTISAGRNAGVMITQDRGPVADFSFARNAADGGACTINITEKSYGPIHGVAIEDNLFGRNTVHANCAIIAPDSTKALMRVSGNFYVPDYSPVTVRRGG